MRLKLNPNTMKNFFRKVVKSFKKLSDSRILTFGQSVVTAMTQAVAVFPTPSPSLTEIGEELVNYSGLVTSAATRDKVQIVFKNQSKQTIMLMLSQLADYVNLIAQGDEAILAQSGFDLNKVPEPISMGAPTRLVLLDGGNSGELFIKFKAVIGAFSYLFQYTADPLLANDSWVSIPATTTSYTFTGLTKGTTYYCRVVAVGANQQLMESIVVNRVSQ